MSEFITFLDKAALKDLEKANAELVAMVANVDKVGQKMKNISTPSGSDNAIKQLTTEYQKQEKVIQSLQKQLEILTAKKANENNAIAKTMRALENETKARQDLDKQRQRELANIDKEQAKLLASQSLYSKVQVKLNALNAEYRDLAVKKELGLTLSAKEEQALNRSYNGIQKYDKALKTVDASMGRYFRTMGAAGSSFNPLSNSVSRIAQELPNLGQSFQIFAMSIGNNFAQVKEAIDGIVLKNKELQAQGKPTESVIKQITSSILSWNTAMYVGIAIFIAYSKEISTWVSSLFGASDALNELNERQKEFNKARFEGKKDAQSDIIELKKYLAVYNDVTLSAEDRDIAYKKLSQQYAYYIKDVKDATIVNGKYSAGVSKLLVDLEKQKALEKETDLQVKNKQKLLDLEKELSLLKQSEKSKEKDLNLLIKRGASSQALATISDELNRIQKRRVTIEKDINAYQGKINQNQIDIIKLTKERIGLEYQEDKQREKKKKDLKEISDLEINQADFLAREYEYRKLILDNLIKNNDEVVKDESKTFKERIEAYNRFIEYKKQLVNLEYDEQKRIIDAELKNQTEDINKAYNSQLKEISEALKDGTTTQTIAYHKRNQALSEKNKALVSLEKKIFFDRNILTEKFVQDQKNLTDEYNREVILKMIQAMEKLDLQNEISENKLTALRNRSFTGTTLNLKAPLKSFQDYYDEREMIETKSREKSLELDLEFINKRLSALMVSGKMESEEYKKLISQKRNAETQLQEIKDANQQKELQKIEELKRVLENFYGSFISELGSSSGFGKMLDILTGGLEKFKGDATAVALAVSDAFQEAFNTIASMSQANFEQETERLSKQKEISLKYAGDSTVAREEIERQYEERRRAIEKRRAEQQKKTAMFNIVVDTAQAIIATFAQTPPPAGIPLALLVGAIGAAQLAMVASQNVPAYAEGTDNHSGGPMLINDAKGSNYVETVQTPDGKLKQYKGRNVLVNAPKGTKVFTPEQFQSQLNNIMMNTGIESPMINVNGGITPDQMDGIIGKHFSKIQVNQTNIDKNGFNDYVLKGQQRTKNLNSVVSFKGFSV